MIVAVITATPGGVAPIHTSRSIPHSGYRKVAVSLVVVGYKKLTCENIGTLSAIHLSYRYNYTAIYNKQHALLLTSLVDNHAKGSVMLEGTVAGRTTDSYLLRRIGDHDEQAFAMLFDCYAQRIFCLSLDITGERATAERVVEQVFATIWSSTNALMAHDFTTWLAVNTRLRSLAATANRRSERTSTAIVHENV